jgi:hypothetical protein
MVLMPRAAPARSGRRAAAVAAGLLALTPLAGRPQEEAAPAQESSLTLPSYLLPSLVLPSAGGGRSGTGGATRTETTRRDVSAARLGVTMDFKDWVLELRGRKKPESDEAATSGRREITWAPIIVVSPVVGAAFGVGLAGTRQRGDAATTRLSTFSGSAQLTTQSQFSATLRTDANLAGGNWNLVGLWRWSRFPTPTWGIGGDTPESAKTTIDYQLLRLYETVNRRVARNFYLGVGYGLDYFYEVADRAAGTGQVTDFQRYPYGTGSSSLNSGLVLNALYDSRDSPVFATRGVYANLSYAFNPGWLGSDTTWQTAYLDLRDYFRLARRLVLGLWSYAWFDFGHVPYLELPSIGNDPDARSGRGYIEGRHVGKALLFGEAELRFVIWEWLGAVAGVNVHSASEPDAQGVASDEPRFRHWWPSVVVGARILVVKATHSNVCIDFAFGRDGQSGIYFNFAEAF